jgi:cysteine desulfurase
MKSIYLDHAAGTPLRSDVLEVMLPHFTGTYGNPSSLHHQGRLSAHIVTAARAQVSSALEVSPEEIIFTCSGTEANNLALLGVAHAHKDRGKHILVSCIEHPSILETATMLAQDGFEIEYVPVDATGRISVTSVLSRIRPDTILISIMYANNEIGTIQPIQELTQTITQKYSTRNRPLVHTDACQAAGQLSVSPSHLGVDLMTLNSSKIYGPRGVGLLYVRNTIRLAPQMLGGSQESGRRAGTENIPNIVGFAHALERSVASVPQEARRLSRLRDTFIEIVTKKIPSAVVNGHRTKRLPNNIHLSIPYIEGESLLLLLDTYGICVSTGSACSAHNLAPSHVLRAIGQSHELIHGSIRVTLGTDTTGEDLIYTGEMLKVCVDRLRDLSPLPLHL